MKKVLLTLALFGTFAAMSAKGDSYMYWMVDIDNAQVAANADYAFLWATDGTTKNEIGLVDLTSGKSAVTISDSIVSSVGSAWSYYVEAYRDDYNWTVGKSELISYADARAIYDGIYEPLKSGGAGYVTFSNFTYSAPEPTSGLLMLIGLCGLALKRKRA